MSFFKVPKESTFRPLMKRIQGGFNVILGSASTGHHEEEHGWKENQVPGHSSMHTGYENMPAAPVVGAGRVPGMVPSKLENLPGLARLEYLSELTGKPIFLPDITDTHFGTIHNPVNVPSIIGERPVACTGKSRTKR
jgi:hypothetical protein